MGPLGVSWLLMTSTSCTVDSPPFQSARLARAWTRFALAPSLRTRPSVICGVKRTEGLRSVPDAGPDDTRPARIRKTPHALDLHGKDRLQVAILLDDSAH